MDTRKQLIELAIAKAGSQAKLAEAIGLSQQGVSYLLKHADKVSAETAVAIERFSGGTISRAALRPDLYAERGQ